MAKTSIGGSYPVQAPLLTDDANIIAAIQLYHLGETGTEGSPSSDSIAHHLSIKANLASPTFTGIVTAPNIISTGNVNALIVNATTSVITDTINATTVNATTTVITPTVAATTVNATTFNGTTVNATTLIGDGANITAVNATAITSGTISNARTTGNTSASANTLVLRDTNASFSANVVNSTTVNVTTINGPATTMSVNAGNTLSASSIRTISLNANATGIGAGQAQLYLDGYVGAASLSSGSVNLSGSSITIGDAGSSQIAIGPWYYGVPSIAVDASTYTTTFGGTVYYSTASPGTNNTIIATTEYVDRGYRYLGTITYTANSSTINVLATYPTARAVVLKTLGGGGGGGGAADAGGSTYSAAGGSGGGGAYKESVITPLSSVNNGLLQVIIGSGGAGGTASGTSSTVGSDGGATSFTNRLTTAYAVSYGGKGGYADAGSTTFPRITLPGSGANTAGGGTLTTKFAASGQSGSTTVLPAVSYAMVGAGGENSLYRSYLTTNKVYTSSNVGASAGTNANFNEYGIGGSGGASIAGGVASSGGAGAQGIAFIDVYA